MARFYTQRLVYSRTVHSIHMLTCEDYVWLQKKETWLEVKKKQVSRNNKPKAELKSLRDFVDLEQGICTYESLLLSTIKVPVENTWILQQPGGSR